MDETAEHLGPNSGENPTVAVPEIASVASSRMATVVGYAHQLALDGLSTDEVCAAMLQAAVASSLVLDGVYVDRSAGLSWRDHFLGRSAFLHLIRRGRLAGLLVPSAAHLGPEAEARDGFLRVLTAIGRALYVIDAVTQTAMPLAPSTSAPVDLRSNGYSDQDDPAALLGRLTRTPD